MRRKTKPSKKAKARRIRQNLQQDLKRASAFVLMCGVMAAFYAVYRIVLIAVPSVAVGEDIIHPRHDASIVCGEEEGNHLKDPAPVLSANYQKRVSDQKALSSNKIANPSLSDTDPDSGLPTGYNYSNEGPLFHYQAAQETDGSPYLHLAVDKGASSGTPPAWLPDPVAIEKERTYAYSFQYRSDVPIHLTLEYSQGWGGGLHYVDVVTLKPASAWQTFTAHFDNAVEATSFRPIINATGAGFVDTRSFNIHQIADAELKEGIVSVTFDDGWQSVSNVAKGLLDTYHIRTTQYIISEVANQNVVGYMDMGTVMALKKAGHEIGSHSLAHCNQVTLSKADIEMNAVKSKQELERYGLGPVRTFAYPLGQYNETTQGVYGKVYPLIRTSDAGYNDRYFDETDVHSMGVLSKTSSSEFRSWLNYAKAHKQWLVIVYHRVNEQGDYNVSRSQLDTQLRMIRDSGMDVLPMSEAARQVRK